MGESGGEGRVGIRRGTAKLDPDQGKRVLMLGGSISGGNIMIRTRLIAVLFAVTACAGTDGTGTGGADRDMSDAVDFTAPANCDLAPYNGEMACDFVSEDGGNRRILLSFNDTVDTEAGAELAPMNAAERTEWFRQLITGIDAGRMKAMTAGYSRTGYRLLPRSETPPGLRGLREVARRVARERR